ncbi:uncharacterized protein LOC113311986 [Papaver somniferum]|uniref:uncharacterized protein LOC113311986 n=1 Tax=Papaver somniferum TaxID=3469 RepID=UPI000E6FF683|nr:uncharacterized protein LOC113311986 [Papaver somniferum]
MDSGPKTTPISEFHREKLGFSVGKKCPSINLPDDLFEEEINPWKFSLIGRLNLHNTKFTDVAISLRKQWKLVEECKLIPIGKGFFTIKLDNEIDRSYFKAGECTVNYQVLRLRNWVSNFRPANVRTSKAQVWVRFPGLGLEFWKEKKLFEICKEIGTPIKIDVATAKCELGLYANVLVEVDFTQLIPRKIWINMKCGGFFQDVMIHECPKFCSTCKIVGHLVTECYVERNKNNNANAKAANVNSHKETPQGFKASSQGNNTQYTNSVSNGNNPQGTKLSLQGNNSFNVIPFDICDTNAREEEDSVIRSINENNILTPHKETISINSRRFGSIANEQSKTRENNVTMEVEKVMEVAEQNANE